MKSVSPLKHGIPWPVTLILIPLAVGMGYFVHRSGGADKNPHLESTDAICQLRQQNYEFARPLLLANSSLEDPRLAPLKASISAYIDSRIHEGVLQTAAVYVRVLNKGACFSVNEHERFSPGSLLKVPLMIHLFKESERNPSLLKKAILFDGHHDPRRLPSILGEQLVAGRSYTASDLLRRMIVHSDNDATVLLYAQLHNSDDAVYADLNLAKPDPNGSDYFVTAEEYSRFFRVLFNATYLTAPLSDEALRIMAQSSFRGGMMKPLPDGVRVPRKFGERETAGVKQFHEFGIVYLGNEPYLLGVMTRGRDMNELEDVVSDLSEIVYKTLSGVPPL